MAGKGIDPVLPMPKVLEMVGVKRTTLYTMTRAGKFPSPVRLTDGRKIGWRQSAVKAWLDARPDRYPVKPAA
jgi:predicted DNA-binding transcriptional regulator AlpA